MADTTNGKGLTRALGVAGMVVGLLGGSFGLYSFLTPMQAIHRIEESVDRIERAMDSYNGRLSMVEGRLMGRVP